MQLKLLKSFFSETMFKGRKNALKFCTIPKENIKQLKHVYIPTQCKHLGKQKYKATYPYLFWANAKRARYLEQFRDPLKWVQKTVLQLIRLEIISAFQNCSKFEDRTYFGKLHYPKENIRCTSYSVSDKVLENQNWATLETRYLIIQSEPSVLVSYSFADDPAQSIYARKRQKIIHAYHNGNLVVKKV